VVRIGKFKAQGASSPGFEEVQAEFSKNFEARNELGAACAVYHRGQKVVDLWGGYRDARSRAPWQEDTMVVVFSTTKGLSAMVMAVAHSRGWFELDQPVAAYWPEFGQHGKERITVRQLLAHEAGLSAIDEPLDASKLADLDFMSAAIAKQAPSWEPGTKHGYHGLSLGWFQNELIRRIDPQHRSLGRFFHEEIAERLKIEFYIGLPREVPEERVATIKAFHPARMLLHLNKMPIGMELALMCPWSLTYRSLMNPRLHTPGDISNPEYRVVEFPSANGIGEARAIARAYSAFATGGQELGIKPETMRELTAPAVAPPEGSFDAVMKIETMFSFGFFRPCRSFPYGSSARTFGHHGAGGSVGFADPDEQIGYAYVTNKMGFHMFNDPREIALREACYRAVRKSKASFN
jgi:CubicO group peptidase (beta-lactamase class C family)